MTLRLDLAKRIGGFVKDAEEAERSLQYQEDNNAMQDDLEGLGNIMGKRIAFLESCLGDPSKLDTKSFYACEPVIPSELLVSIQQTLHKSCPVNSSAFHDRIESLNRPSWLTRSWPYLITSPLLAYYAYSKVYNSRANIAHFYTVAKETVRGFAVDWVIDPCLKILATLRHGDSSLAIMGRQSLKSDFDVSSSPSSVEVTQAVVRQSLRQNLRLAL